jgi:hypothetical protein
MKLIMLGIVAVMVFTQATCGKVQKTAACFKGRLEVKGMCSNYTIGVLEGNIDPAKLEASWTDETTGKSYNNVFALGNPCSFPESIREGQTFYFTVAEGEQNCVVCQAYYPKPAKQISITVLPKSCE